MALSAASSRCLGALLCCVHPSRAPLVTRSEHSRRVVVPRKIHAVLAQPKARVIIIGDVHGCFDELLALLDACDFNAHTDTVILVGDLVNKGPKSAEVVAAARERGFFAVRGNHDDSSLFGRERRDAARARGEALANDDKYSWTDQLSEADLAFLRELPYTLALPTLGAMVVHAGLVPGVPLEAQELAAMYTMRNLIKSDGLGAVRATWSDKAKQGVPWAGEWPSDEPHVFFGHDVKRGLQLYPHATGLDTGCCYGKSLSAMIVPERRLMQVSAHAMYVTPDG